MVIELGPLIDAAARGEQRPGYLRRRRHDGVIEICGGVELREGEHGGGSSFGRWSAIRPFFACPVKPGLCKVAAENPIRMGIADDGPQISLSPCGRGGDPLRSNGEVSDCLSCQAGHAIWFRVSRAFALSLTRSLWARAMRMTFLRFPASLNRLWKAAKSGLYRRTRSATTKRIERMPSRPPRMGRLPKGLPPSRASRARPASLAAALLDKRPSSGISGMWLATVRSAA